MMCEERDIVSTRIDKVLQYGLSSSSLRPSIRKIEDYMTNRGNENLHEPKLVSIGPLYHGKGHLQKMEQQKFRYLRSLLEQRKESTVDKYVKAMRSVEEQARRCYADTDDFSSDNFVEMLLLDGCFIVEFIRKYKLPHLRERDDPIFIYNHILYGLVRDLMLLENQIPFFVLDRLFSMTVENQLSFFTLDQSSFNITIIGDLQDDFISLIQLTVGEIYPWHPGGDFAKAPAKNAEHLLDLMYATWCSSSFSDVKGAQCKKLDIQSATELQEAGIVFDKQVTTTNLLDIKFNKGVLTIPNFMVADSTEEILRNLILYEQFSSDNHRPNYLTDYTFFLHCLINSSKDVEILRLGGILSNMLGDDDTVHHMLKRLGMNAFLMPHRFCYADVFERVNAHYERRRNRWMAILRRNYFNSPWAYVSFLAAVVLLLLTLIQAVFSVLSYAKGKN